MVPWGLGRHIGCISPDELSGIVKWANILQLFTVVGVGFAKISICLFVLRVTERVAIHFTRFLWILIVFVSVVHLAEFIITLVQCVPMSALWNWPITGRCFSPNVKFQVLYGMNGKVVNAQGQRQC